jgi:LPS O-antigen subunit length determinant protein (WzzB/FepE family)
MIPRSWIISAALAALVLSNGASLMRGKAWGERVATARFTAAQARAQTEIFRAADALSMRAFALQEMETELSARAMEAEDAARRDFDPSRVPTADSLHRLETRWRGPASP